MKKCGMMLSAGVLAMLLVTANANAQGSDPPPGCCRDAQVLVDNDLLRTSAEGQIDVTESTLQFLRVTRGQFLDRLAAGIFPGKRVDLVLASTRLVLAASARSNNRVTAADSSDDNLVAVQEKRFYRISRNKVRSEELDTVGLLYLTDGEVYIKVGFTRGQ